MTTLIVDLEPREKDMQRAYDQELLANQGWYKHLCYNQDNMPSQVNLHTHGLFENYAHPDFQICFPLRPVQAAPIFDYLAEAVKSGVRFKAGEPHPQYMYKGHPLEFVTATEDRRRLLRVLLPAPRGIPEVAAQQRTLLRDGSELECVHYTAKDLQSPADLAAFIEAVNNRLFGAFVPGVPFGDYLIAQTGLPVFTRHECRILDELMRSCTRSPPQKKLVGRLAGEAAGQFRIHLQWLRQQCDYYDRLGTPNISYQPQMIIKKPRDAPSG